MRAPNTSTESSARRLRQARPAQKRSTSTRENTRRPTTAMSATNLHLQMLTSRSKPIRKLNGPTHPTQ
jgi:hypothetical protein